MKSNIELLWVNSAALNLGLQIQEHSHICYQLYYILQGDPIFVIRGKELQAHPSTFFYIPPYTPHRMLPVAHGCMQSYELKFILHDDHLSTSLPSEPVLLQDDVLVKRMFHYIIHNWRSKNPQNVANIEYFLYSILSSFFLEQMKYDIQDSNLIDTGSYSPISRAVMGYIENHFHDASFSMQKMADSLNYHKNYLSNVFSRDTGISIVEYLNLVRVRQALIFFAYYNQDAFTTFESTGFTNHSHFSRVFKSFVGISPRNFKYAFSSVSRENLSRYFTEEPILNYCTCSLDEAFMSLKRIGAAANQILAVQKGNNNS